MISSHVLRVEISGQTCSRPPPTAATSSVGTLSVSNPTAASSAPASGPGGAFLNASAVKGWSRVEVVDSVMAGSVEVGGLIVWAGVGRRLRGRARSKGQAASAVSEAGEGKNSAEIRDPGRAARRGEALRETIEERKGAGDVGFDDKETCSVRSHSSETGVRELARLGAAREVRGGGGVVPIEPAGTRTCGEGSPEPISPTKNAGAGALGSAASSGRGAPDW